MSVVGINGGYVYRTVGAGSENDMSMEEYKQYIYGKISEMPLHPSHSEDFTAVSISDEGFAAMKSNPAYENYIMTRLSEEFSMSNPYGTEPGYNIYNIGKDFKDFKCEHWNPESKEVKKQREKKERERSELMKRRRQKEQLEKSEHYRQYSRRLRENSIRKAQIENDHIKGNYDDHKKSPKHLNAISSYKASLDIKNGLDGETL